MLLCDNQAEILNVFNTSSLEQIFQKMKTFFKKMKYRFLIESTPFLFYKNYINQSSSEWRVTVSGDLMSLESYCICDVTNTVTLHL